MSLTIGRLALDDPEIFDETAGEAISRVGATPVPGARAGLAASPGLTSWADTSAHRARLRRQLRALVNNLPCRMEGLYLAWSEDPELSGWYVPGQVAIALDGTNLDAAVYKFTGEWALVGRRRTHRRAVAAYARDLRDATTPRDFRRIVYSTDFSGMTPVGLTWLPSAATDLVLPSPVNIPVTGARQGFGSSMQALIDADDLTVVSFEQAEPVRNRGDVVVYDRRGTLNSPTSGPHADWEEVYGSDWPLTAGDVPVLDNSLTRIRWTETPGAPGFALDRWEGAAWAEQGKVLIERLGDSNVLCDTLVWAQLVEWTPDRAVVLAVLRAASDDLSRESVYLTLQRGWTGPRVEVYPAPDSGGAAGAGVHLYRAGAPSGTETGNKYDGSLQTSTGSPNFTPGAVGASTFTGENWVVMRRSGVNALALAAVQAGATGRVEANSSAYGSARNGISVKHATAGYVSAHIGMNAAADTAAIDSTNDLYDGARDLGESVLIDARGHQTIVAR